MAPFCARAFSSFGKCHVPAAENSCPDRGSAREDGNRENYGLHDSNCIDRFTVTVLLTSRTSRCILSWMRCEREISRECSRVWRMMNLECVFSKNFREYRRWATDTRPLSRTISKRELWQKSNRWKCKRASKSSALKNQKKSHIELSREARTGAKVKYKTAYIYIIFRWWYFSKDNLLC